MNFGIIVEDARDGEVYSQLIRKIRNDVGLIVPRPCGGIARLKSTFVAWLKEFQYQWIVPDSIDKVLVVVDSDGSDALTRENRLKQIHEESHFQPTFPVHFHVTTCEVETWLLADEIAVARVSQERGKNRPVHPIHSEPESHPNAKEMFQRMLSEAKLPADPQVYKEVAGFADIARIAERCPLFRSFAEKVHAC